MEDSVPLSNEEESRLYFSKTKDLLGNRLIREQDSQEDWKQTYFSLSQALHRDVFTPIVLSKRFYTNLLLKYTNTDPGKNDNAALIYACKKNLTSVAILLLSDKRVDPNAQEAACLMSAVSSGDGGIVRLLLDSGAISKENKKRALLWAQECRCGRVEGIIQSHLRPPVKISTRSRKSKCEEPVDYSMKIDRRPENTSRGHTFAILNWVGDN